MAYLRDFSCSQRDGQLSVIERQQVRREFPKGLQFILPDVVALVLSESENHEPTIFQSSGNDDPCAAALALLKCR